MEPGENKDKNSEFRKKISIGMAPKMFGYQMSRMEFEGQIAVSRVISDPKITLSTVLLDEQVSKENRFGRVT